MAHAHVERIDIFGGVNDEGVLIGGVVAVESVLKAIVVYPQRDACFGPSTGDFTGQRFFTFAEFGVPEFEDESRVVVSLNIVDVEGETVSRVVAVSGADLAVIGIVNLSFQSDLEAFAEGDVEDCLEIVVAVDFADDMIELREIGWAFGENADSASVGECVEQCMFS